MGVAERRAREKDELRRTILEAATELFVEQGYQSVSMRKIADRIEYAPSTIYLHFKDKVDLLNNICSEMFEELDRRIASLESQEMPPLSMLRQCLRSYVEFGLEHPSHYIFVFCTPPQALGDMQAPHCKSENDPGMQSFSRLRDGIALCMGAGEIRQGDVETTAQCVWLMVHGLTAGLVTCQGFPFVERERLIESTLDAIIRGLQ